MQAGVALDALFRRMGLSRTLKEYTVLTGWEEIVGPQVARVATPQRVRGGTLLLEVSTAAWRNELQMRQGELLTRIAAVVGKGVVKDIRFR